MHNNEWDRMMAERAARPVTDAPAHCKHCGARIGSGDDGRFCVTDTPASQGNAWTTGACSECGAGQGLSHSAVDCGRIRDLRAENERLCAVMQEYADLANTEQLHAANLADEVERLRTVIASKTALIAKLVEHALHERAEADRLHEVLAMDVPIATLTETCWCGHLRFVHRDAQKECARFSGADAPQCRCPSFEQR